MNDAELVKVELAARATSLHKSFLYKMAAAGRLPCYRAGRALRFSIPELLAWMRREAENPRMVGVNGAGCVVSSDRVQGKEQR